MYRKKAFTKDTIKQDARFHLSGEEIDRLILLNHAGQYRFISISLGEIRRWIDGQTLTLDKTDNYQYLVNPMSQEAILKYRRYCSDPVNLEDNPARSCEEFDHLKNSIENEGYDPKKSVIVIDKNNCIINGLHRCCILLSLFGPQHEIQVVQVFPSISIRLQLTINLLTNLLFKAEINLFGEIENGRK